MILNLNSDTSHYPKCICFILILGASRSYKSMILDIFRECQRILKKNAMDIPEWFDDSTFETGNSVIDYCAIYISCLKLWKEMKLEKEFRNACASVPPYTTCCGLVQDDDQTIQETAMALNRGWIKDVNQRLKAKKVPFKLDVFVWSWHNATGKAKTSILLIRFLMARR